MIQLPRFLAIVAAATLAACQPKNEEPAAGEADAATQVADAPNAAAPALLAACTIRMSAPETHEWKTWWDPAHIRTAGQNPSGVRSTHWASAEEVKIANDNGTVIPFEVLCGSDDHLDPRIKLSIVAYDSTLEDVPLGPGTYRIAPKASPAKNKPGEFIVAGMFLGKAMFAAQEGTLVLTRFDSQGAAGSFTITGNEILMGTRPMQVEGTFDMPCRKGLLQSACESDQAEQPQ
jgi:hypothetical protein